MLTSNTRTYLYESIFTKLRTGQRRSGTQKSWICHFLYRLTDGQYQGGVNKGYDNIRIKLLYKQRKQTRSGVSKVCDNVTLQTKHGEQNNNTRSQYQQQPLHFTFWQTTCLPLQTGENLWTIGEHCMLSWSSLNFSGVWVLTSLMTNQSGIGKFIGGIFRSLTRLQW